MSCNKGLPVMMSGNIWIFDPLPFLSAQGKWLKLKLYATSLTVSAFQLTPTRRLGHHKWKAPNTTFHVDTEEGP